MRLNTENYFNLFNNKYTTYLPLVWKSHYTNNEEHILNIEWEIEELKRGFESNSMSVIASKFRFLLQNSLTSHLMRTIPWLGE